MGLVITISGPHGSGKTTYAHALARELGLRYVSAGQLFRQLAKEKGVSLRSFTKKAAEDAEIDKLIDERTRDEARKGNVVIEGQLAGWAARKEADVRIYLVAPNGERYERIARRDRLSKSTATEETRFREEIQRERYKRYYGVDIDDLSIYDVKIDTSGKSVKETTQLIRKSIDEFLAKKNDGAMRSAA